MIFASNKTFKNNKVVTSSCLILIFLFGYLLRLITAHFEPSITRDGVVYIAISNLLHSKETLNDLVGYGQDMPWEGPPFLVWTINYLMNYAVSAEVAGQALNITMGSFLVYISYGIAYELFEDRRISLLSSLFISIHPTIIELSIAIQRDIPYLFFIGLVIYYLIVALKHNLISKLLLSGLFLAFALLARFESFEFLPLFIFILVVLKLRKRITNKRLFIYLASFGLSFIVSIYLLMNLFDAKDYVIDGYIKYLNSKINDPGFFYN